MNPVDDFLEGFKEQPGELAQSPFERLELAKTMAEHWAQQAAIPIHGRYMDTLCNVRGLLRRGGACSNEQALSWAMTLEHAAQVWQSSLTLSQQQRAFLDTRLGASLVTLASDFRQQFNTTAEQTCALINQWANT